MNFTTSLGSLILFFITSCFIIFILDTSKPKWVNKKNTTKINYVKISGISVGVSLLFTIFITYISSKVDEQKKNII
jgi:hypothetical protein